jgi:glucokinase
MTKLQYVLSIDLGGHNLRSAFVSSEGEIFESSRIRTFHERTPEGVLEQIAQISQELIERHHKKYPIIGVGLGIPGFVIPETGSLDVSPNFPTWKNVPVRAELTKRLSMPVMVENDGNCAALGGYWKDNPKKSKDYIFVTIGTGVGGGIVTNGNLVRGAHGAGTEIGHMQINHNGPLCGCGSYGCLESFISGSSLEKKTGRKAKDLYQDAVDGSTNAKNIFEEMGETLGMALSSLCYIFDPEVIAIGGRVSQAFEFFSPAAKKEIQKNLSKHPAKNILIIQSECWDNAGILGAAKMIFDHRG